MTKDTGPARAHVAIAVDEDVLAFYKGCGADYRELMAQALRATAEACRPLLDAHVGRLPKGGR